MELGDASNEEAPPPSPRNREMLKYLQLQMILILQSMQCDGSLWRGLITIIAKRLTWHAAQYINYESRQCACMPQVILFLQELIPRKKFWEASYISKRVHPGGCQGCPTAEEAYPKKTCNVNGDIKDNCALLDCCFDHLCSL